jgi:tRNA threonylcarbamoyladenosine biosynthesis protein TsaE
MNLFIDSLDDIRKTARQFIDVTAGRTVFAFYGAMGAGKTSFIKAVCEELGVEDVITSPTFAIINEYALPDGDSAYHFDFYRINKVEEAFDLGYEEYFYSDRYCFIEWPEKIEALLPSTCTKVEIEEQPDGTRKLTIDL